MNYHNLKEAKKNPYIFNLMFKNKLSFRDLVDTCVGWE